MLKIYLTVLGLVLFCNLANAASGAEIMALGTQIQKHFAKNEALGLMLINQMLIYYNAPSAHRAASSLILNLDGSEPQRIAEDLREATEKPVALIDFNELRKQAVSGTSARDLAARAIDEFLSTNHGYLYLVLALPKNFNYEIDQSDYQFIYHLLTESRSIQYEKHVYPLQHASVLLLADAPSDEVPKLVFKSRKTGSKYLEKSGFPLPILNRISMIAPYFKTCNRILN